MVWFGSSSFVISGYHLDITPNKRLWWIFWLSLFNCSWVRLRDVGSLSLVIRYWILVDCFVDSWQIHRVICLSMEEAKKNMYAFSTTTYTGFQCTVDEATSEKFKGGGTIFEIVWIRALAFVRAFLWINCRSVISVLCRSAWGSVGTPRFIHRCEEQGLWRSATTLNLLLSRLLQYECLCLFLFANNV